MAVLVGGLLNVSCQDHNCRNRFARLRFNGIYAFKTGRFAELENSRLVIMPNLYPDAGLHLSIRRVSSPFPSILERPSGFSNIRYKILGTLSMRFASRIVPPDGCSFGRTSRLVPNTQRVESRQILMMSPAKSRPCRMSRV